MHAEWSDFRCDHTFPCLVCAATPLIVVRITAGRWFKACPPYRRASKHAVMGPARKFALHQPVRTKPRVPDKVAAVEVTAWLNFGAGGLFLRLIGRPSELQTSHRKLHQRLLRAALKWQPRGETVGNCWMAADMFRLRRLMYDGDGQRQTSIGRLVVTI